MLLIFRCAHYCPSDLCQTVIFNKLVCPIQNFIYVSIHFFYYHFKSSSFLCKHQVKQYCKTAVMVNQIFNVNQVGRQKNWFQDHRFNPLYQWLHSFLLPNCHAGNSKKFFIFSGSRIYLLGEISDPQRRGITPVLTCPLACLSLPGT